MSKKIIASVFAVGAILGLGTLYYFSPAQQEARFIDQLVAQNMVARGGETAWSTVNSIRLVGQMDVGQDMLVPYTLDQARPDKMRLEFVFNEETVIQSTDGKTGWKLVPFLGRTKPESMTDKELREAIDTAHPYGLLFNYDARGHKVELLGKENVGDREAYKLKVILPHGTVRWVFLDTTTALEIKVETRRNVRGKERRVETFYEDWRPEGGLLIAHRQVTTTEGEGKSHFITVDNVMLNPALDATRFAMPTTQTNADAVQEASL